MKFDLLSNAHERARESVNGLFADDTKVYREIADNINDTWALQTDIVHLENAIKLFLALLTWIFGGFFLNSL